MCMLLKLIDAGCLFQRAEIYFNKRTAKYILCLGFETWAIQSIPVTMWRVGGKVGVIWWPITLSVASFFVFWSPAGVPWILANICLSFDNMCMQNSRFIPSVNNIGTLIYIYKYMSIYVCVYIKYINNRSINWVYGKKQWRWYMVGFILTWRSNGGDRTTKLTKLMVGIIMVKGPKAGECDAAIMVDVKWFSSSAPLLFMDPRYQTSTNLKKQVADPILFQTVSTLDRCILLLHRKMSRRPSGSSTMMLGKIAPGFMFPLQCFLLAVCHFNWGTKPGPWLLGFFGVCVCVCA